MKIKKILDEFSAPREAGKKDPAAEELAVRKEIEALALRLNRCFTEVILPAVFDVESDLNQFGYWNQLNIGQSTSLQSGKPNIKEVSLSFYPSREPSAVPEPYRDEAVYQARIAASGNLRQLHFSLRFPKRIPPTVESDEDIVPVDRVDQALVDGFLERFVKEALDAFNSDRMLR